MDDVEPIEFDEESVNEDGEPGEVTVTLRFKSGHVEVVKFRVPVWTPIYGEPVSGETIFNIIASAYSMGEAPFFALPTESGSYKFFDLAATDYVDIDVRYDDD